MGTLTTQARRPALLPRAAVLDAPPAPDRSWRTLQVSARPLIALATQLHRAVLPATDGMKRALAAAVDRLERELTAAGWDERQVAAASYLLCTWVDQVVADTPWGGDGGAGLLERFHGEPDGSERILRLLSRLAEAPQENQALLQLFHTCLSLGLNARPTDSREAMERLERLRQRVFLTLPQEAIALAPPWHSEMPLRLRSGRRRTALGALLLLALAALGIYTASHLLLAARVDGVFSSMQRLSGEAGPEPGAVFTGSAAAAPRIAPLLADDIAAGRLGVRDEAHRSVITLPADRLFEAGSARLAADAPALLRRVGAALAGQSGKIVVIGHTDGHDTRTARLPSPWHQSFEWARETAEALGRALPAERLAVEGAADLESEGGAAGPRRRIDIVLYP